MDSDLLVDIPPRIEGGADGLDRAAKLLREAGVPVIGVYLVALSGESDVRSWHLRIVTDGDQYDALFKAVDMRRHGIFPDLHESVSISPVRSNHPEASRVLRHARRAGASPTVIDGQMLDGLYVDYALVGSSVCSDPQ